MALSWQHIKGANAASSSSSTLYTVIEFSTDNNIPNLELCTADHNLIGPKSGWSNYQSWGKILTTDIPNQVINQDLSFATTKKLFFGSSYSLTDNTTGLITNGNFQAQNLIALSNLSAATITTSTITSDSKIILTGTASGSTALTASFSTLGSVYIDKQCEALYYNARSDSRAKENLVLADIDALKILNHLPVYTFNYLNHPNQLSLGILAQDIVNDKINEFSFVENPDADGKNTFMSLRESKLVYLLMIAIKQQQQEIEDLKAKIKDLK